MRHDHAVTALFTRARRLLYRVLLTTWRAVVEFVDDRGHRDAAQIAFFAVLSVIPLALLLIGAFGLVFDPTEIRDRILATLLDNIPLAEDADRAELEGTISDSLASAGNLRILPRIVDITCNMKASHPQRRRVCEGLTGEVVEIGFGSGLNVLLPGDGVAGNRGRAGRSRLEAGR